MITWTKKLSVISLI